MRPLVILIVFGVILLAELPDKSLFASLILGSRYRAWWVFAGVASAFAVHVVIAVTAGGLLSLLPHRVVAAIVAALFLAGGALLVFHREQPAEAALADPNEPGPADVASFRRVAATSFAVIFVGEWGDITQITTANYAARYDDPVSVGIGAVLGLWVAAALAITLGKRLMRHLSPVLVRRVTGVILLGFGVVSAVNAAR